MASPSTPQASGPRKREAHLKQLLYSFAPKKKKEASALAKQVINDTLAHFWGTSATLILR